MGELQADIPIWLYILFGIIYFLSKLRKKPAGQSEVPDDERAEEFPNPKSQPGRDGSPAPGQMTFEELLREISQSKEQKKPSLPLPELVQESYDESDVVEEDLEELEEKYRNDKVTQVYEEAKRQAFSRPSLEETLIHEKTDMSYGRFKEFERQDERGQLSGYLTDLRDTEGLKKAFVLSEILKRKF